MSPSSKSAVRRVLAVLILVLLLPAVLPAADAPTQSASSAASLWSSLSTLWEAIVRAACERGISIDPNGCPTQTPPNGG
jgi:hypothetical protein